MVADDGRWKAGWMRIKLLVPRETLLEADAIKINAEAENGSFTLLPRHADFVAALVPGILTYTDAEGEERYFAVDSGVLVKQGDEVLVSVVNAFEGPELGSLREVVRGLENVSEERDQIARNALARLEVNIVRRFLELGK